VGGKPNKNIFLFTPTIGVEQFWVDLMIGMFLCLPQSRSSAYVSGVYVILILRECQTSHKAKQSLTKLNAKTSSIYVAFRGPLLWFFF